MAGRVTATATCRAQRRWRRGALGGALAVSLASCAGTTARPPSPTAHQPQAPGAPGGSFAWLAPTRAPAGWRGVTSASGEVTLFYPPAWKTVRGDTGSVTAVLRDRTGRYLGYLNDTPRQGAEQPRGWAGFRTQHNRAEGDKHVHQIAAAQGLAFSGARGSCVIDDYLSRVGSNPYRELACLVAGPRASSVFIGAALAPEWGRLAPTLERAASAFREA